MNELPEHIEPEILDEEIEGLIDIYALAKVLEVSTRTIYTWVDSRAIPYIRIGSMIRFRKSKIEAWIISRSIEVRVRKTRATAHE